MYQKIKYIIIATMVLLILVVVITLDANTRYAAMQKEKKLKQQEKARAAQEYYQKQQQEMQARRLQNSIAAGTQNFSQYPDSQQQAADQTQEQNTTVTTPYAQLQQQAQQQPQKEPELAIVPFNRGYLVDEKSDERLDNYQLAKLFKLNDDTYAIITNIEQDDINEGFVKQKIVIYKKVDESYQYAKYIFTKSLNQAEPEENATIDVKEQGDNLMIKYSGKGSITRVITKDSLKSSRPNTSSHPALGYVEYTTEYNLY